MARTTADQVILELVRQARDGWHGKTKLFKAFYFAHLFYAKDQPGILTSWPIVRLPQGPGISKASELIDPLVASGSLIVNREYEGPYPEYRYELPLEGKTEVSLPDDAKRAIQQAAEYVRDKTGAELSQIIHDRSRAWREGQDGEVLDIYVDLIPDEDFEEGQQKATELHLLALGIFEGKQASVGGTH